MESPEKYDIRKTIFQIKYQPKLSFYEKLYSNTFLFNEFPHWLTDRLKVTLRDYDLRHSLTIKHDSMTYESDLYKKSKDEKFIKLVSQSIDSFIERENLLKVGHRVIGLKTVSMEFSELVNIINMKFYSEDFLGIFGPEVAENSISIASRQEDIGYQLTINPLEKKYISQFVDFNFEHHINPQSSERFSEIVEMQNSYPEVAIGYDIDLQKSILDDDMDIEKFYFKSKEIASSIIGKINSLILDLKIK